MRSLAVSAVRGMVCLKRWPQDRQREASSTAIGDRTATIVEKGDGANSAVTAREGESRNQRSWAQEQRYSCRRTTESGHREDWEDGQRRYVHRLDVEGSRMAMGA